MEIKLKNLNKHEHYACSIKDIKKFFLQNDNLFISFGFLNKNHRFDSKFIKHPRIEGLIISSIEISRRLNVIDLEPIWNFYVIKDDMYNEKHKDIFCESILPKINKWYHEILLKPNSSIPGVEAILVELTVDKLKLHICRFP